MLPVPVFDDTVETQNYPNNEEEEENEPMIGVDTTPVQKTEITAEIVASEEENTTNDDNDEPESIIGDAIYHGQQFFMIKQRNCIEFKLSKFVFLKDLW